MSDLLKRWRILRPKTIKTVAWDSPDEPEIEWVPQEGYPTFATYEEALRTAMGGMDPALRNAPVPFLRRHLATRLYRSMIRLERVD